MTKEEKELIDAITRDRGLGMTPIEELSLLGFYEAKIVTVIETSYEDIKVEPGGEFTALDEIWEIANNDTRKTIKDWNDVEEYEFYEDAEEYKELTELLKINNDRRKYFA